MRVLRARSIAAAVGVIATGMCCLAGCAGDTGDRWHEAAALTTPARAGAVSAGTAHPPTPSATPSPYPPGVGARLGSRIPAASDQVVVADGVGVDSSTTRVTLYRRTATGWLADGSWQGHNALHGWTSRHQNDDLRSPIGVYTLTDAGGELPDPGTSLHYVHSSQFATDGTGFDGESLAGSFDYVIAINYNRIVGTSPIDSRRPEGWEAGGFIWLHVDHGGPTHGCVSVPKAGMVALLRALEPTEHPVIVMGDAADLAAG